MNRFVRSRFPVAILVALVLAACSPLPTQQPELTTQCLSDLDRPPAFVGVYVLPDDGRDSVLDEIRGARCTIDLGMYLITDEEVFAELESAATRGVRIRVILEQSPYGMVGSQGDAYGRLAEAGIQVKWSDPAFTYGHAKYLVIDRQIALITNQNFTASGFESNREFGAITTHESDVEHAQSIFDADWDGRSTEDLGGPLVVSPENARERVLGLIDSAQDTVQLYAEVIRDEDVIRALAAASARGVSVQVLLNETDDPEVVGLLLPLQDAGVEIRILETLYVHAKTLIVDGERALIGSINYSYTSLDLNREVGIIVDKLPLLDRVNAVWDRDWLRAVPVRLEPG